MTILSNSVKVIKMLFLFSGDGAPGHQGVDVFNMLVSVYGSKELFVKEYRNLLAERLSSSDNKDVSTLFVFNEVYIFFSLNSRSDTWTC